MTSTESAYAVASQASPENGAKGGWLRVWIYPLLWFLFAATLIGIGDRLLRGQEKLAATLADSPVVIPFSDYLQEQVRKKMDWNALLLARTNALATGDTKKIAAATYALSSFATDIAALDTQRRQFLLDLVDHHANSPESISAYFQLFDPRWSAQLSPRYADFTQKVLAISKNDSIGGASTQMTLAQLLDTDQQPALEIQVLQTLQATQPMSMEIQPALQRLLTIEAPSDPNREKLKAELAAYAAWHDQLIREAQRYQAFEAARRSGNLQDLLQLRSTLPPTLSDSFAASADAHLIDMELPAGQFDQARSLRETLAHFDPKDLQACSEIAMELAPPMAPPTASPNPRKPAKTPMVATALPDQFGILFNRWRGLLALGDQDGARAVADTLFVGGAKKLAKPAADLASATKGDLKRLLPIAKFQPRSDALPPEMLGATDVSFAAMDLKPVGKGIPAGIHARLEMWISGDQILQVVTADESRLPRPKPRVTKHDEDPWQDEYFEFFLSPDCWFNFYYHWVVTSTGVTWDARRNLISEPARLQFAVDKHAELGIKARAFQTPTGWTVRILLPRKLLIPPGKAVVRFNVRRNRHVREKNMDIQQFYSWAPITGYEHAPDKFGWLVIPQ